MTTYTAISAPFACENSGIYVPMLSPPFITVMIETLSMLFISAILDFSGSSSSVEKRRSNNFQTPSRMGSRPRNLVGSEGSNSKAPKPIILMMTITVNPMYSPRVILRGVTVLLVDASAKIVTKPNMSWILVTANELHNASGTVVAALIGRVWTARRVWITPFGVGK